MFNIYKKKIAGYTIIETLIAISIFLIIIIAGMSSLLTASNAHQKTQDVRSIMDSLTFVMEEISRNLRTGYDFTCISGTNQFCGTIVFENAFGDSMDAGDNWAYKVESSDGGATYNISKSTNNGASWVELNQTEVKLSSISGFSILGPASPPGDTQQPLITVKLSGTITYRSIITPFSLQTSVSQRLIDI